MVRCNQRLDGISLLTTSIGWDGKLESDSEDELPTLQEIESQVKHLAAQPDCVVRAH
jgi:hypothetical protein